MVRLSLELLDNLAPVILPINLNRRLGLKPGNLLR